MKKLLSTSLKSNNKVTNKSTFGEDLIDSLKVTAMGLIVLALVMLRHPIIELFSFISWS